jgi:hypothetical protein
MEATQHHDGEKVVKTPKRQFFKTPKDTNNVENSNESSHNGAPRKIYTPKKQPSNPTTSSRTYNRICTIFVEKTIVATNMRLDYDLITIE